jgi:PAS domain S-box-containing protein
MKLFEYQPVRKKLKLVIISTCVLTIILVFSGFFIFEHFTFRKILINDLSTKADIIAENSNAALTFRDSSDAARILSSLASQPNIIAAAIYDNNEKIFASYEKQKAVFPLKPESADTSKFNEDAIVAYKPIILNQEQIGTLYLSMDLEVQRQRFWSYIGIALVVLFGSLIIAYIVATILAKNISAPIISLAETSQKVSQQKDYSIRAEKISNDETGFLADSFNEMLTQIQERDADLHKTNETIKNAEKRYRTTLDHMLEGCQIIGLDWRYLYLNDVAIKHSRSARNLMIGKTMMEVYPGIENSEMFQQVQRCIKERLPHEMENEFVYPDGEKKWFTLSIEPVPEGIFILSVDITEEKKLQEELNKYNQKLEELVEERTAQLAAANKDLESFSYSVSHDLRAPLRAINGYTKIFEKKYGTTIDKEGHRLLNIIENSAVKMGVLIDDLLSLSRLGRTELAKSAINMSHLTDSVLTEINKFTKHKAKVRIHDLKPVMADYSLMSQVMMNLISNAIKYSSKREKPVIEIRSEINDDEVIYCISDNGAGFDMNYADKLFGVFQRLHSESEFEGTGVGLAIVHLIIRKHGGKIWAEGKVNEGAAFYFSLPKVSDVSLNNPL